MRMLPRSLNGRLILLVSCILLATGVTHGWVTAHRQSAMLITAMRKHAAVMVHNFSHRCAYFLVLQDFAGLDAFLLQSAGLPDILHLQVCEADGSVVGDVENGPDGKPEVKQENNRLVPPATLAATIGIDGGELVVWQPIEAGDLLEKTRKDDPSPR